MAPTTKKMYRKRKGGKGKARRGKLSQGTKVDAKLRISVNGQLQIGPGSSTNVDNYFLGYVTALGAFGANGGSFFQNQDYKTQAALYDEVCIKSYTVKFMPVVNTTNLYDQGFIVGTSAQTRVQPNIYTWFDRDSSPLTVVNSSLPNKLAQYDSYKRHSCFKPWSRTMKMKPIWLACDGVASASHLSIEATIPLTQAGLLGNFGIYGQNLPWSTAIAQGNESYGQMQVTWNFAFRGKRPVNTTVDDNGIITITPARLYAPIQPTLVFPPPNDEAGVPLSFDGSGNAILVIP